MLSNLAKKKKCWVTGGLVEPASVSQKGINRSLTFSPGGQKFCSYGKIQPAVFFREDECHEPGERVEVFPLDAFHACPLICYDLRFPELFRIGMQKGANLFINGTTGETTSSLGRTVLSMSIQYPIAYGFSSIILVVIFGATFSYIREFVHYLRFDLNKKKYVFFKKN